jgi:hypothetical protein
MDDFITKSGLRERGWSDQLISKLLGEPDQLAVNPRYRSGPKMKLWDAVRVAKAEQRPEWIGYQPQRAKRSAAGSKATEVKRDKLLSAVEQMPIAVQRLAPEEVIATSLRDWDEFRRRVGIGDRADASVAPREMQARWAVNYIRHTLTAYDGDLAAVAGKVGAAEATRRVKERVLDKIATVYPEFAAECYRQIACLDERMLRPRERHIDDEGLRAPKGSRHIQSDKQIVELLSDVSSYMFGLLNERSSIALNETEQDAWLDTFLKWAKSVFDIREAS